MRPSIIFFVIILNLPVSFIHAGGNGVSNGGGFSKCADNQLYAYDYLLTLDSPAIGPEALVEDIQSSFRRISSELKRLGGPLAKQFDLFTSLIFTQKAGEPYQWFERQNLILLWDPDLTDALPKTCLTRKQAVYFTAPFAGITDSTYVYDPVLLQIVLDQKKGALQVSYLFVHEWLWNYFDHVSFMELAAFNRLLHSEKLSSMSAEEFAQWRFNTK